MSEGFNKWIGMGNLGADPELKMTAGGQAVLKLRIACTENFVDKNQTRQERTEWVRVTVFGKRGEGLAKHLAKGDRILVEGRLQTSSYEKDGQKHYSTEVVATEIRFAGGGKKSDSGDHGDDDGLPPASDDENPL